MCQGYDIGLNCIRDFISTAWLQQEWEQKRTMAHLSLGDGHHLAEPQAERVHNPGLSSQSLSTSIYLVTTCNSHSDQRVGSERVEGATSLAIGQGHSMPSVGSGLSHWTGDRGPWKSSKGKCLLAWQELQCQVLLNPPHSHLLYSPLGLRAPSSGSWPGGLPPKQPFLIPLAAPGSLLIENQ